MAAPTKQQMLAALLAQYTAPQNQLARPQARNHLLGDLLSGQPRNALAYGGLLDSPPRMEEAMPLPPRKAYDTPLSPQEEFAYRAWMLSIGHTPQNGFAVDNNFTGENYDYRGYFKKYGPVKLGEQDHLTDEFKLPTHPSFSNESQYAKPGSRGAPYAGSWRGEQYTPSLARYFQNLRKPK